MDFFKSHCLTDPTMVSVSPTSFNIVGRSMLDVFCGVGCCWIKSEFACAQTFSLRQRACFLLSPPPP